MSDGETTTLQEVVQKVADGAALDAADWARVIESPDLIALGMAADARRRRRHGDRVTFVQVVEAPLGEAPSDAPLPAQTGEVRVTGCPTSDRAAVDAVRAAVLRADGVPVTGFTFADLDDLSGHDPSRLGALLAALREAGLGQIAEISAVGLRDPDTTVAVLRASQVTAARLTLGTTTGAAAVSAMQEVASWSGIAEVCRCLAPLPRVSPSPPSTGYADLRQVALARLLVDNIESIQVDWTVYGPKLAQVALTFGADDVDAVPVAGAADQGWRRSPETEIRRNITGAGFRPVRRNGRFEVLDVDA
ncbi:MAG: hypothetical protein O3A25_05740 [Acidobacteria bacterium]|nr:hypothetical protein [Acidobacteriota bacterium]